MAHFIEITSRDNQTPLLFQIEKDEIEEGRKVYHSIDIEDTNRQDPSGSQIKKSLNQIYTEKFTDLDNSFIQLCTIFKVNMWLRKSNPDAYTPKMVSIGPYHKENPQLHPMEKYKLLYLHRFLKRKKGLDVESCISELKKLEMEALKCYENIEDLDPNDFCQMLLLDGCFVVEFIQERSLMCPGGESTSGYICHQIFRDLILVENQLPFFVLDKLHCMTKQDGEKPLWLLAYIWCVFFVDLPSLMHRSFTETLFSNVGNIKHLLHLVHIFSCDGQNPMDKSKHSIRRQKDMPNATELSEAGVSFVKKDNTSFFDIKFENGSMKIPHFEVFDYTETFLCNLIAYEQQSSDVQSKYFSDYVTFMDHLIDSEEDVNLLREKGIIENWMGDDKQVACLFNKIGNGVGVYSNFYYIEEFKKALKHCEKPWNKKKANLLRNYFSSPWVGASTIAAIILLILTTIQAILAFTGPVNKSLSQL